MLVVDVVIRILRSPNCWLAPAEADAGHENRMQDVFLGEKDCQVPLLWECARLLLTFYSHPSLIRESTDDVRIDLPEISICDRDKSALGELNMTWASSIPEEPVEFAAELVMEEQETANWILPPPSACLTTPTCHGWNRQVKPNESKPPSIRRFLLYLRPSSNNDIKPNSISDWARRSTGTSRMERSVFSVSHSQQRRLEGGRVTGHGELGIRLMSRLLIPLNKCRHQTLYQPWKCEDERHGYEKWVSSSCRQKEQDWW
jgi:hypothetical protein